MIIIGVQGAKGSFCEQAANSFARSHNIDKFDIRYLISSNNVLAATENKEIDYGVLAIENAKGGVVIETVEALGAHRCNILSMFHVAISQNLLGLPGTQIEDITEIHSHQQALRQCQEYLSKQFWGLPLVEADDTAESARRLHEGNLPKTAAVIANKACAELYGLEVLQEDIHDLKNNLTLFLGVEQFQEV